MTSLLFPPTSSCWAYWIVPIVGAVLIGFLYRYYMAESRSSWGDLVEVWAHIFLGVKSRDLLWGLQQCPLLESCQLSSSPLEPRWLIRYPPLIWDQCSSSPRALLPKHLLTILRPFQDFFSSLVSTSLW
jgi:hypothetical protein